LEDQHLDDSLRVQKQKVIAPIKSGISGQLGDCWRQDRKRRPHDSCPGHRRRPQHANGRTRAAVSRLHFLRLGTLDLDWNE